MKILIVDNNDSFTYNLAHLVEALDCEVKVVRSNLYHKDLATDCDKIILSPGPGLPADWPEMQECIDQHIGKKPILGVCLGMQALCLRFGGELYNQKIVKHGIQEEIKLQGASVLLKGLPDSFEVGLYHSWACDLTKTKDLKITSLSYSGVVMSFENVSSLVFAVQFHPESIMTELGFKIIQNFLEQ